MSDASTNPILLRQLLARLQSKESLEVEFKRGKGGLPHDLWPTVSAFANTNGGWILVGILEEKDRPIVEGVPNPHRRLQEFFDLIRNRQKISSPVCGADDASIEPVGDESILVIRVPAASRKNRPVYIGRNPYEGTYLRRHSGDYRCTKPEVDRMMREASDVTADSTILPGYRLDDLDLDALTRYRRRHQTENPGSPWNADNDEAFLMRLGGIRRDRQSGDEGITVAGLLLFGKREALRDWRGRHLIDFRRLPEDGSDQERWSHRVAWEEHLFGAFETIYPLLVKDLPVPFQLKEGVRRGEGPAHDAMREALVNLLVHADYSESQASLIFRHDQGCDFRNPGNSRVPREDLISGDRSDPRNPYLVSAFRYIGLADEAGTGIPKIVRAWRQLGFEIPDIDVGTERYEFTLRLRYIHFLSEEDRAFLTALGDPVGESKQLAIVHAKEHGTIDNAELRRLTGLHPADATKTLTGLRDEGLFVSAGLGPATSYSLSPKAQAVLEEVRRAAATADQPDLFEIELASPAIGKADLDKSQESFAKSEPSFDNKEAELDSRRPEQQTPTLSTVAMPASFPGPSAEWESLLAATLKVRQKSRVEVSAIEAAVLDTCTHRPLSVAELSTLLGKSKPRIRQVVQTLRKRGQLRYARPDAQTSPNQRYITASSDH